MNPFTYVSNVITGRFGHFNTAREQFYEIIMKSIKDFPKSPKLFYAQMFPYANHIVEHLIGPSKGNKRILKIDPLKISQQNIVNLYLHTYYLLTCIYTKINSSDKESVIQSYNKLFNADIGNAKLLLKLHSKSDFDLTQIVPDWFRQAKNEVGVDTGNVLDWCLLTPHIMFAYTSFIERINESLNNKNESIKSDTNGYVIGKSKYLKDFLPSIEEYVKEADRVYRNLIDIYSKEYLPAIPNGKGLFIVRLIFSFFWPYAFFRLFPNKDKEFMDMFHVASGSAMTDLVNSNSFPSFSREEAKEIAPDLLKTVIAALTDEFKNGPSKPNALTKGFEKILGIYHDALRETIGTEHYTTDVKNRFEHLIISNIGMSINNIRKAF